jgi:hypothetical protein
MRPPRTGFAMPKPEALSFGRHKESSGLFESGLTPLKGALLVAWQSQIHGSRLGTPCVIA